MVFYFILDHISAIFFYMICSFFTFFFHAEIKSLYSILNRKLYSSFLVDGVVITPEPPDVSDIGKKISDFSR